MRTLPLVLLLAACDELPLIDDGDETVADSGDTSVEGTDSGDTSPTDTADSGDADSGDSGDSGDTSSSYLARDVELCELVNDYRVEQGRTRVPLSLSLMTVARDHVEDAPGYFASAPNECNLHSWSDNLPLWGGCCYTPDHAEAQCMWDKPREITAGWTSPFTGNGYENSAWGYGSSAAALEGWKSSSGHNDAMLEQGIFSGRTWLSIGCAAEPGGYYYLWFSDSADPNGG